MKRYLHKYTQEVFTTFNEGNLVPIMWFKAAPNETIRLNTDMLVRTQPLNAPAYSKTKIAIQYYAVPMRIMQTNWDKFRTGGTDGESTVQAPYITIPGGGFPVGHLADYLRVPTLMGAGQKVCAFPFRAYGLINNWYIRDKDLQAPRVVSLGDGSDTTTDLTLANVCWEKNTLTTARPTPQRGSAVTIPLTGDAPVLGIGPISSENTQAGPYTIKEADGTTTGITNSWGSTVHNIRLAASGVNGYPTINADLSAVSGVPLEDLRMSAAVQRFKEALNMYVGGGTLAEFYRLFGVAPQDSRMQWPERLGGGESVIQISEVLQTGEGTNPVGELRGHGIGTAKGRRIVYKTTEDCIIMGVVSIKPKTVYMQGLEKQLGGMWSRYDYFLPQLQNLGQQPIQNKEVYLAHAQPDGVFGYQDNNYWYRRNESYVSGEFRSTLKFWHQGIEYSTSPALNSDFVEAVPSDEIFAAGGAAHQLQCRVWNRIARKSPVQPHGNPMLK